ncbi:MAG: chemotaxis protein CheC [Sulfurimicrobium sp.]|nr:chemotaxis protein CheC [Sulfurimicrobium sp.]
MTLTPLSADQRDALQEITNVAMGQAGASLATTLDTFITLSIPRITIVDVAEVANSMCELIGRNAEVTAARQSFNGYLRGEVLVIYGQDGCNDLADLMGYDDELDRAAEQELLLDVSNVLVGACLCGIAEQLRTELSFSAPSLIGEKMPVDALLRPEKLNWSHALLMEVNFRLEERNFTAHLVMLMPEEAIDRMRGVIDDFIESF